MLLIFGWILKVLKDTVLRMNLQLSMCRGQCYDGAANMKKAAEEIKAIEPKALLFTLLWP